MQGTETWRFIDGDKTISVHPQGGSKGITAPPLSPAAIAGLGGAALPDFLIEDYLASGALVPVMTRYPSTEADSPPGASSRHLKPPPSSTKKYGMRYSRSKTTAE